MHKVGNKIESTNIVYSLHVTYNKWVPVTTAWRVLRLRMEERPPVWRVAANIFKKAVPDSGQRVVLQLGGLGEVLITPHRKTILLRIICKGNFLNSLKPVSFSRTLLME